MKFIHSADWQLGKPYGRFESEVRAGLSEARFEAIDTLGRMAVEYGAQHVVVAGDISTPKGRRTGSDISLEIGSRCDHEVINRQYTIMEKRERPKMGIPMTNTCGRAVRAADHRRG